MIPTQICKTCGEVRPLLMYHRKPSNSNGHMKECKFCANAATRARNRAGYGPDQKRSKRLQTIKRRESGKTSEHSKRMYQKYPEKSKARAILNHTLKKGEVVKLPCYVCGVTKVEAHHQDYNKPLEVIWVCRLHHNKIHREIRDTLSLINK